MSAAVREPWTMKKLFLMAFLGRLFLIFYARIHDYFFEVHFTDIDYEVFTEAALLVRQGHSPYEQPTYRYTPVIAWLLVPNAFYTDFGKVLFCVVDVFIGYIHLRILETELFTKRISLTQNECSNRRSTIRSAVLWWLFNPFTAIISARGSSDAMICALILFTLFLLVKCHDKLEQYFLLLSLAAVLHGAGATHFRIFPLIYLPSVFLSIAPTKSGCHQTTRFNGFKSFVWMCATNFRGFSFISLSLASFALSVAAFFALYGQPFVHAAFVYHLSRADIQHNFSPYFLPLYLSVDSPLITKLIGLIAFVPQIVCISAFALRYSDDLPFCWFLTTFAFVSFNKVCTSQYFVWYLCFLPLLFTRLTFRWQHAAKLLVLWLLGQAFWLLPAYLLEFRGMPTFTWTWLASLTFLGINIFLIFQFVQHYASPSFSRRSTIERREMTKIQ